MESRRLRLIVIVTALLLGLTQGVSAQDLSQTSVLARWTFGEIRGPEWEGQRLAPPEETARPESVFTVRSPFLPVNVHATAGISWETANSCLADLEFAFQELSELGWPQPIPDGGRSGTAGFDLFLLHGAVHAAEAYPDARVAWSAIDAVSTFGVVDPALAGDYGRQASVISAYLQAVLLGQDPAESRRWRRATGAFGAWQLTGEFGAEGAVDAQQQQPWRSWISSGVADGEGGALLLALLSARFDGGDGHFIRELWQFARQHSRSHLYLRGAPDLWQTLERMVAMAGTDLETVMEEIALSRVFAGPTPWLRDAATTGGRVVGVRASVPVVQTDVSQGLPIWIAPAEPALEPYGSHYVLVRRAPSGGDTQMRLWLKGEYGVKWSLLARKFERDGSEIGRISTSAGVSPEVFFPLYIEDRTSWVLLAGMHHSHRLPDADIGDPNVRSLRMTIAGPREGFANGDDGDGGGDEVEASP